MPSTARLLAFLELARPHNVLVAVLNGLVGVVAACTALDVPLAHSCLWKAVWALLSIAFVSAAGYAVNDYFDADIDAVSKPWRPIPSGRVTPGEAHIYSLILFAVGIYAGFVASPLHGLYALIVAVLLYAYPAWMKRRRALLGHLTVAATGASTIVYGGLAVGACTGRLVEALLASLLPSAYAFLLILAREFVKALEDYEGDRVRGAATIATVYGVRIAVAASATLLLLVAVAAPLPVLVGYGAVYLALALLVAVLSIYSTLLVMQGKYGEARRVLKIAFGVGGLAFLLDPLLRLI